MGRRGIGLVDGRIPIGCLEAKDRGRLVMKVMEREQVRRDQQAGELLEPLAQSASKYSERQAAAGVGSTVKRIRIRNNKEKTLCC